MRCARVWLLRQLRVATLGALRGDVEAQGVEQRRGQQRGLLSRPGLLDGVGEAETNDSDSGELREAGSLHGHSLPPKHPTNNETPVPLRIVDHGEMIFCYDLDNPIPLKCWTFKRRGQGPFARMVRFT